MAKWRICVDLDSAREEADDLESRTIEAKDEDEAMKKAAKIIKEEMYGGPYYNLSEYPDYEESEFTDDDGNPISEDEQARADGEADRLRKGEDD